MTIQFSLTDQAPETATAACIVVGVYDDRTLTSAAARVDEKSGGAIKRLLESGDVSGKIGSSSVLFALPGISAPRVLVEFVSETSILVSVLCAKTLHSTLSTRDELDPRLSSS